MLDLLVINGTYPDFDKDQLIEANIGVKDGKITYIGCDRPDAAKYIDAEGSVVSPGFIDIHMHEENFAVDGEKYIIADLMLKMGVTTACGGNCGLQFQYLRDFKRTIEKLGGSPVNYVMLAGYNVTRFDMLGGGGVRNDKAATAAIIEEELAEGAFGISFGIEYSPQMTYEEMLDILALLKTDHRYLAAAHYRASDAEAVPSVKEMIRLCEEAGVRFQISHLGSCAAMGEMTESLRLIEECASKNPDLRFDIYPYNAFSTMIGSAVFEPESMERWCKDLGQVMLTAEPYKNVYCTEDILKDAREKYPTMTAVGFTMKEEEVAAGIANPYGMIASDAILNSGQGHPRASGTFPRVLGKYVREDKVLSMVEALKKMTLYPAERLSLHSKGRIELDADGDLTVFNPNTVTDRATYTDIYIQPEGIDYVILGGRVAMDHKTIVNDRLGRFIPFQSF